MTRTAGPEKLAVRLCYGISENPADSAVFLGDIFDEEYYATLADEDELFKKPIRTKNSLNISDGFIRGIAEHGAELDGYIDKYAVGWKFGHISRTAVAILKTAMFEVLYMPDVPNKAAINEAVEISKRYEQPETV